LREKVQMAQQASHVPTAHRFRQTRFAGEKTSVFDCEIQGAAMLLLVGSAISMT
jgi:hypothetical protein